MIDTGHPDTLDDFVNGRLGDEENEAIISHLVSCQECELIVEQLWYAASIGETQSDAPEPEIKYVTASERSLFRRIHRSELGGQLIKLYTKGFLSLLTTLIHPLASNIRKSKSGGG